MGQPATNQPEYSPTELADRLKQQARQLGFTLSGIAEAGPPETFPALAEWLDVGMQGEMEYMSRRREAYADPNRVLANAKSVIMVAESYYVQNSESPEPAGPGRIARYAQGVRDYHEVLKEKLRQLAAVIHDAVPGAHTRAVVDTAPVLERDFARKAGLGWFGKNTMLINKRAGSFLFLGALLTDVVLPSDPAHETDHCGTCTRCLDACPTQAFPQAHILDARRCISYLTIELRNASITEDLREGMGDWLFGCDVCQDVCPWNRKASTTADPNWQPRPELTELDATTLLSMSSEDFQQRFADTPLERTGRATLARNAAIVMGNTGQSEFLPELTKALGDEDRNVREASAWAIQKLGRAGADIPSSQRDL